MSVDKNVLNLKMTHVGKITQTCRMTHTDKNVLTCKMTHAGKIVLTCKKWLTYTNLHKDKFVGELCSDFRSLS